VKEGRADDIRPCIACNETCLGKRLYLSCTVNPQTGNEKAYALTPMTRTRKCSSSAAARRPGGGPHAAARGCDVTLWEASGRLGGKLWIAATPEFNETSVRSSTTSSRRSRRPE